MHEWRRVNDIWIDVRMEGMTLPRRSVKQGRCVESNREKDLFNKTLEYIEDSLAGE